MKPVFGDRVVGRGNTSKKKEGGNNLIDWPKTANGKSRVKVFRGNDVAGLIRHEMTDKCAELTGLNARLFLPGLTYSGPANN